MKHNPWRGLHVLADDDPRWLRDPVAQAEAACAGGAHVVQLRAKHASDRQTLAWAHAIRARTREAGLRFVLNDRADLAFAARADAVHLGQDDLPPDAVPGVWRAELALGRSSHTPEQAACALQRERADYIAFGPLFETSSKRTPWSPRGQELLGQVARRVAPLPLVAIGGIDLQNIARARAAGAAGVAVLSAVAGAADPVAATRALVRAFEEIAP